MLARRAAGLYDGCAAIAPERMNAQQEQALRSRVQEFRERQAARADGMSRSLPTTCEFCTHLQYEPDLLATTTCAVDRRPDLSGGCDAWAPRYRTDDEETT